MPRAFATRRVRRIPLALAGLLGVVVLAPFVLYFAAPQSLLNAGDEYQRLRAHLAQRSVQAGDTRWVYDEGGRGPTVLLVHGYMDDRSVWLGVAQFLTPHVHVVIPDLPGWGDSSRDPQGDYGYAAQADRLHAFVQALHLERVVVAGHSMGGGIAGVYASRYPQDVSALILIDSAGAAFRENGFSRDLLGSRNPLAGLDRPSFERGMRLGFFDPPRLPARFEDVLIARNVRDRAFNSRVLQELMAPEARNILAASLPRVTVPALAIGCREDHIIDISALDTIRGALTSSPRVDVTTWTGCGHMVILERPRAIAEAISREVPVP